MRWRNPRRSDNIEDRRGKMPMRVLGGGIGGIIVLVIALLLGADPGAILNDSPSDIPSNVDPSSISEEEREPADFVLSVLADTEDTWSERVH